jgi:ribosome-associated toxin RatA of RatAB toxin-antitoxin module
MAMVEDSILIDAPAERLFALSQDYRLRRAWDPFVKEMRFLNGAAEAAKGACVWVRAWTGLTMVVQFTSFRPPTSVAMKMVRGPWFFRQFAGTWLFAAQPSGQTLVTFRYAFATRRAWRLVVDPFIRWLFQRDIRGRLRGLKMGAEQDGLLDRLPKRAAT